MNTKAIKKAKRVGELLMSVQVAQQDEAALLQQLIANFKQREKLTRTVQELLNGINEPTLF